MKICATCNKEKVLSSFYSDKTRKDGYYPSCRTCERTRGKKRSKPEVHRNAHLKRTYGINIDDYNRMFEAQKGRCLICDRHQSELKSKLHVDHCHIKGTVRGLLCFNCNQALGNVSDSIQRLEAAISYLRQFLA